MTNAHVSAPLSTPSSAVWRSLVWSSPGFVPRAAASLEGTPAGWLATPRFARGWSPHALTGDTLAAAKKGEVDSLRRRVDRMYGHTAHTSTRATLGVMLCLAVVGCSAPAPPVTAPTSAPAAKPAAPTTAPAA